jgi:hypothetical protein
LLESRPFCTQASKVGRDAHPMIGVTTDYYAGTACHNPAALVRAIRVLGDRLLASAPDLVQALRILAQDFTAGNDA